LTTSDTGFARFPSDLLPKYFGDYAPSVPLTGGSKWQVLDDIWTKKSTARHSDPEGDSNSWAAHVVLAICYGDS